MIVAVILLIVIIFTVGYIGIKNHWDELDFTSNYILWVFIWLAIMLLSACFFQQKISKYDYYKISDNQYLKVETYHYNSYIFNDKNIAIKSKQYQEISKIDHFEYIVRDIH